ncbi:MAG TPA: hypothetical protein RMH99_08380 [Sandaracinaceae bacterium LLY-WYZ-13_1]|nr:hypothetical protein [Sandaracinaceae bacterium LLY-WYZ-13_1]
MRAIWLLVAAMCLFACGSESVARVEDERADREAREPSTPDEARRAENEPSGAIAPGVHDTAATGRVPNAALRSRGFRALDAPGGSWGDHRLRRHPSGAVWLAAFRRGGPLGLHLTGFDEGTWRDVGHVPMPHGASSPNEVEIDAQGTVHVTHRSADGARIHHTTWRDGRTRTVDLGPGAGILTLDAVGRARVLVREDGALTLFTPRASGPPTRTPLGEGHGHPLLAFHVSEAGDVTLASTDPARSRVRLVRPGAGGATAHPLPEGYPRRFVSAAFDRSGTVHVAAEHRDGADVLYVRGSLDAGFTDLELVAEPGRGHAHPLVSTHGRDALIVASVTDRDLGNPRIALFVVGPDGSVRHADVGPYDLETERYTAPTVAGDGSVFIGSWGSMGSGDGRVRTNAPAASP